MATARSQEASSPIFHCPYNVFLSFRGKDTRNTFTDHLYTALVQAGIRTFRDDDELERGENIELELHNAIQQSKISMIIFSKDYASSSWCLDELLMILERKKTVNHIILPVFYHVAPSQVRKQTDSFAKAFEKHEKRFKAEIGEIKKKGMAKVERWKAALTEVADLAGMVLKDGEESKFIQSIVKELGSKLNRTILSLPERLIGMDSDLKDINLWLQDGSTEVGILMICGMGGIGKTTISKTVYNLNFDRFECSSFLANVREMSEQPNGLVCLQKQLLSDILKGRKVKIRCVDEGIIKIRDVLCCKRVLLVLDDIDHVDQLNAVVMMEEWFYPGSKIIITTRNEQLLKSHNLCKVHKVKELGDDASLQLFCWHAFGQDHPIEGYMEHSVRVVHHCGGLPLALKVLGCSLFGRSVDVWESALKKLEAMPDTQIHNTLKISYDSLDDHDQNLFLDIACFFVGEQEDDIIPILDGCDFYTKVGIQNLSDRCLLIINEHKHLQMHQLLQDMGREIVRQESLRDPSKRSRLWHYKDSFKVLIEKTGTETIEGLTLDLPKKDKPTETFFSVNDSKRHQYEAFKERSTLFDQSNGLKRRRVGLFSWLPINHASSASCSISKEVVLPTDVFSRMQKLRILQLSNVQLTGSFEEFPKTLRYLSWHGSNLKSIPSEFPLQSLVALYMRNSSLEQVWRGTRLLILLKILNLSHSHRLSCTPAFSELPNLERLILKYCINLIEIHESIGKLGRLVLLNLKGCKNLRKLPREICLLKCLEELTLSGCSRLDELPTELGKMESLTVLHADGINNKASTTNEVKSWYSHFWPSIFKSRNQELFSFSLASLPHSLKSLSLVDCNLSDDAIPKDLGSLHVLQRLDLSRNPICGLPESIKNLTMLESLVLNHCEKLQSIPELPTSLKQVGLFKCRSLQRVGNLPKHSIAGNSSEQIAEAVFEVEGHIKLEPLRNTDAEMINNLRLFYREFIGNIEVKILNAFTKTVMKVPPQGLYEFGIFSTFLPGSEVPAGFFSNNKSSSSTRESLICMNIPSLDPNRKVQGLNICVVYGWENDRTGYLCCEYELKCSITINNKTQNLAWGYRPSFVGIPGRNEDMMWLSHWTIWAIQLEGDDEVDISVSFLDFRLKWFGFDIVYDDDDNKEEVVQEEGMIPQNTYPSPQKVIGTADLSEYKRPDHCFYLSSKSWFYGFDSFSIWPDKNSYSFWEYFYLNPNVVVSRDAISWTGSKK